LRENFGAQLLEASAKGCPIITLENSAACEWFPPNALFTSRIGTPLETISNLSSTINDVLGLSDEKWAESSAAAISFARENTTHVRVKAMNRIYENHLIQ
jgi:hypothetical protein